MGQGTGDADRRACRERRLGQPDGGLPSLDALAADVSGADDPAAGVPDGAPIPGRLVGKAARALEAPPGELVRLGVITSGDVLAAVLPQITSRLIAADFDDPTLGGLQEQAYAAFRRRRSLLLLNLEHQVRFEELPWVTAAAPCRSPGSGSAAAARQALRQAVMLSLTAFPQSPLPNTLLREFRALARQSGLDLPLTEEVAADIFMGTFTAKWRDAAGIASRAMAGTVYGKYYDLPPELLWAAARPSPAAPGGLEVAADFAALCNARAAEAGTSGAMWRATAPYWSRARS